MHIRDYLHDIPLKALKTIACALDVSVAYEARIKLINAIDRAFWDGTMVERLMKRLSPEHRRVLGPVAFAYDAGADEKRLLRKCDRHLGMGHREARRLIDDLSRYGLVGCIQNDDGLRYFCPGGVAEQIRRWYFRDLHVPVNRPAPIPPASAPSLLEDIFSLLALVYKSDITLTLTGKLRKSVLEKAFSGSLTCRNSGGAFPGETRNTIVIDYLTARELMVFDRRIARTTERLSGWLDLSMTERYQDITAFLLDRVIEDEYAVIALSGICAETPGGHGFELGALASFLATSTLSQGGNVRIEAKLRTCLSCFAQLGLLSNLGGPYLVTGTGERFFRGGSLSIDENISGDFTIQPNFEVIVGPELDPRVRFRLELLADRTNRDMVLTYAVTGEAIGRARERGMSVEAVISFFHDHARNEMPQNVLFSLEAWANRYGSIYFENVVLMRCRDTGTCDSLAHMPELAPFVRERLAPTVLIVAAEQVPAITGIIKDAGFQPELYGAAIHDTATSGVTFMPATVQKMLDRYRIPEFGVTFAFPDHLIENGDEP